MRGIHCGWTHPPSAMPQLIVKQLDYDLTPVAGLALVGHQLKALQRKR